MHLHFTVPEALKAATTPGYTAHRAVNAVAHVCAAAPGIRTSAELPQFIPDLSAQRSEEHTSELQSLMRNAYAVFCLNKNEIKYRSNQRYTVIDVVIRISTDDSYTTIKTSITTDQ